MTQDISKSETNAEFDCGFSTRVEKTAYAQCLLRQGDSCQAAWIPRQFAVNGAVLNIRIIGAHGSVWSPGWKVIRVYETGDRPVVYTDVELAPSPNALPVVGRLDCYIFRVPRMCDPDTPMLVATVTITMQSGLSYQEVYDRFRQTIADWINQTEDGGRFWEDTEDVTIFDVRDQLAPDLEGSSLARLFKERGMLVDIFTPQVENETDSVYYWTTDTTLLPDPE